VYLRRRSISRTGNLPFKRGFEKIIGGLDSVPVIPVHLDRLWGSVFGFKDGNSSGSGRNGSVSSDRLLRHSLPATIKADKVRQTIAELGSAASQSSSHQE
jgi:acyl-[acyl-carrier-protein]-phospholipid O-acyltransferase/long-chain-fatty-acid--[acyl-carrier-protein] ligase